MTLHLLRLAAAALALQGATAFAQAPAADCANSGVWLGTIGKARVSMAFSDGTGRYYYGNNAKDLVLTRDPSQLDRWFEADLHGHRTGTLTLTCATSLRGTWTTPSGERAQAVVAERYVPAPPDTNDDPRHAAPPDETAETDPEDAAVDGYLQARKANPPSVRRIDEHIGPHRYVRYGIHDFGAVSVELQGSEHGLRAINGTLRQRYATALDGAWGCTYWALAQYGPEAAENFVSGDRILLWHGSTVVVESWSANCARDAQTSSEAVTVFDTASGQGVHWPFPYEVSRTETPPPGLMAEIARRFPDTDAGRRPECAGFPSQRLNVLAWPEQDGLTVSLSRVGFKRAPGTPEPPDCRTRLTLPYDVALPLLPQDRRKWLADMLAQP